MAPKPPKIGWAGPFKLGWLNKDKNKYAILADFRIEKEKVPLLKEYPRRSAEIWAEEKYEDMYLDPISLLGADTPWADMGVLYQKQDSGVEKLCYCAVAPSGDIAQAPSGTNTFIPDQVKLKDPKKKKEKYAMFYGEGMDMMTDDQRNIAQAVVSAIFQSPEFGFLRQLMEAKKKQETDTTTPPMDAPAPMDAQSPAMTPEQPMDGAQATDAPQEEGFGDEDFMPSDSPEPASPENSVLAPEENESDAPLPIEDGADSESDDIPPETDIEEDSEEAPISASDEDSDGVSKNTQPSSETPASEPLAPSETLPSEDEEEEGLGEDNDIDNLDTADESDEDFDDEDYDESPIEEEEPMDTAKVDDFERRIHRLEVLLNASLKKSTTQERYSKLSDLRQRFLFDEAAEREKCAYAKMNDDEFKAHCDDIEANYRKNPNYIEVPAFLTQGASQYAGDRPGAVQYSKEREDQIEAEVMKIAHRNAFNGTYQRAEDIRAEVMRNLGNAQ